MSAAGPDDPRRIAPGSRPEREARDEVALHLEYLIDELTGEGLAPEDARREALRRFGDLEPAHRASRAMARSRNSRERRTQMWTGLTHDVRHALRRLAGEPAYTVTVIATLALGLGAVALIGALVWGVLLRPLPFPEADRLVAVWQDNTAESRPEDLFSPANFLDLRASATTVEELGARLFFATALILESGGAPEQVLAQRATPSFLHALRPAPVLGRLFTEEEGEPGRDGVALLTHAFWQERFGGDPAIVGRAVVLDGRETVVVGVLPPSMRSINPEVDLWTPLSWDPTVHFTMAADQRTVGILHLVGRVAPGAGPDGARAELAALADGLAREYPDANAGKGITLRSLRDELVREVRPTLVAFAGALALLLLIAAVNVTTLQMSRAGVRGPAFAVRSALGAGRLRLARLAVLESVIPALLAALVALLLASWALEAVLGLGPVALPREHEVRIDLPVAAAVFVLSVLMALLTGLPSALASLRASPSELGRVRDASGGRGTQRLRTVLVATELALSLTLLVGAGLLIRSFQAATAEDPGFRHRMLLSSYLDVPESRRTSREDVLAWYREALEDLRRLPGAVDAGLVSRVPLQGWSVLTRLAVEGRDIPDGELPEVEFRRAWPGYFELMGVPVLEGRTFGPGDVPDSEPVAVINETAKRRFFGGEDAIGQRVHWSSDPAAPPVRIVGVVGDVRHFGLDQAPAPELFIASSQAPSTASNVLVRTERDPATLVAPLRRRLSDLMPGRPAPDVILVADLARASVSDRRFNAAVLATFAIAALMLAMVGTYGAFSYWVAGQRRALGIRMAMGAAPADVFRLVFGRSARTVLAGLALGSAAVALLSRVASSLLYGVAPGDPAILLAAAALLAASALGATWLPARRAATVDPARTLSKD